MDLVFTCRPVYHGSCIYMPASLSWILYLHAGQFIMDLVFTCRPVYHGSCIYMHAGVLALVLCILSAN